MVTFALPIAFASTSCNVMKCPVAVYVASVCRFFLARMLNVPLRGTGGDEVVKLLMRISLMSRGTGNVNTIGSPVRLPSTLIIFIVLQSLEVLF